MKPPLPLTRSDLSTAMHAGLHPKFLFFWGHSPRGTDVDKSCLSQWYLSDFEVSGDLYRSAEHWMMAGKARLFDDEAMLKRILSARTPAEAKKLGRKVAKFDPDSWNAHCLDLVTQGNIHKFAQNPSLAHFLERTRGRVLVEAAPNDVVWGIGFAQNDREAGHPDTWKGQNLLGFALMKARESLRSVS